MADTTPLDDWLQARHSNWNTPTNLINEYVRKATGSAIEQASRVVLGVDNEVYDVTTAGNHRLIVRISHKENHRFEAERWALHTARLAGVPTPQVLSVEQAEFDGIPVTFCIEEKVSGKPLDMLLKEGVTSDLSKAIDQIGEVLSLLHSVRVDGFGYLQPDGKGQQTSFAEIMLMANERQTELYEAASLWNVPARKIKASLELLNTHRELYQFHTPVLVHGDLGPQHIFVEGGLICGVIDMQDCSGNPNVYTESYETLFRLVLLRESLIMLMVHAARKNPNGIQGFLTGMERALRYFF